MLRSTDSWDVDLVFGVVVRVVVDGFLGATGVLSCVVEVFLSGEDVAEECSPVRERWNL